MSSDARLSQSVVSVGDPAIVRVNLHQKFATVDAVCFGFEFANDLLDPGEVVHVTPFKAYTSLTGPGFTTFFPDRSDPSMTICLVSGGPFVDIHDLFKDGKEQWVEVGIDHGSVQITRRVVTVVGSRR